MTAKISFFPVGNGDMTLIQTESGKKILIDTNIRADADNPSESAPDVASLLRERLTRDSRNRLYVDVLLLSHPDRDHCAGLKKHFHLGSSKDWSKEEDKIFVRELWSSPIVFRRASKNHVLCDDAKAFNAEARRRVKRYRESPNEVQDGDRILILGEDENGKTDDLGDILIKVDEVFSTVNGQKDSSLKVRLLAPLPIGDDETEELLSKNNSSTILQLSLSGGGIEDKCRLLTGGDAEVAIWEKIWERNKDKDGNLIYDVLLVPHHCSWHSLSYDSWSDLGEEAEVSEEAFQALSQARDGATIVASSEPIKDNDNDPPCIRAKREYEEIAKEVSGEFRCVGEYPNEENPEVMVFEISINGVRLATLLVAPAAITSADPIGRKPQRHG